MDTFIQHTMSMAELTAAQKAEFFSTWKQSQFSGQLILSGPSTQEWIFHLYMGRILYATGGTHPIRRWRRNLIAYCPQMSSQATSLPASLVGGKASSMCWEYRLLCLWVEQRKVTREQAAKIINAIVVEVLFDLTQARQVTCTPRPSKAFSTKLVLIDAEQAIAAAQDLWDAWQAAKVADRSPNWAPVIKQSEQLRSMAPEHIYQTLTKLLDGKRTLRDLAIRTRRNVVDLTRSLLPYIQLGLVELVNIPDLPNPATPAVPKAQTSASAVPKALIACIDDSPVICQSMEKILTAAGYQFLGIDDALRSLAILLTRKPDLIFLDLVMPNANGYEICTQLQKLPQFQDTPIIILTSKDGLVDRVRAKLVGASGFLNKPANSSTVLDIINKFLKQEKLT
ncbi:MAG: response regulator [Cyanothece sp. SIO1E1]|nr:response regulator [Cyanothece sp. SIO1E1]